MIVVISWGVAALLLVLVMLVTLPVRLCVTARSTPDRRVQAHVAVLGGAAPPLRVFDSDRRKPKRDRNTVTHPRKSMPDSSFIRSLPSLVAGLLAQVRIVDLKVDGAFGFDDPADTGLAFGLLTPMIYGNPPGSRLRVIVQPVFDHACLSGLVEATVAFTPIRLLPPVARHLWCRYGTGRL